MIGSTNVFQIEVLLFPGFGQTQAGKFFQSSDVMRVLKMELFTCKILSGPSSWHHLMGRTGSLVERLHLPKPRE